MSRVMRRQTTSLNTVLGSYILVREIAQGGMGTIYEGLLNPFAELGTALLSGQKRELRPLVGIDPHKPKLDEQDRRRIRTYVRELTADFLAKPDAQKRGLYDAWLGAIAEHRRIAGDYRRAIKVLHPEMARDSNIVRRFRNEVDFLANSFNHPNIVKVVESGQQGDVYFAAMEFIDAVQLDKLDLSITESTTIIMRCLEAVMHAHDQGVLHRDIKPGNILVTRDLCTVKLTDFGIAKKIDDDLEGKLTATGLIIGTPFFMDPERARGTEPSTRSDVYSLGATLYHFLTRKPPLRQTSHALTPQDAVMQIAQRVDPPWVREVRPDVSEELEDVVMMMLAKKLDERLETREALALLRQLSEERRLRHKEDDQLSRQRRKADIKAAKRQIRWFRLLHGDRDPLRLAELHERIALLRSRKPEEINDRLDEMLQAIDLYESAMETVPSEEAERLWAHLELLRKRVALDRRRMEAQGVTRREHIPSRWGRKLVGTVVAMAVLAMAGLFGYQTVQTVRAQQAVEALEDETRQARNAGRYDEALQKLEAAQAVAVTPGQQQRLEAMVESVRADQRRSDVQVLLQQVDEHIANGAWDAALDAAAEAQRLALALPEEDPVRTMATDAGQRAKNCHRLAQAESLRKEVREQLQPTANYAAMAQRLQQIKRLLAGLQPHDGASMAKASVLRQWVERLEARIGPYKPDIAVFQTLAAQIDEASAELERLKPLLRTGDGRVRQQLEALMRRTDAIRTKMRIITPEAIGAPFHEKLDEIDALLSRMSELATPMDDAGRSAGAAAQ